MQNATPNQYDYTVHKKITDIVISQISHMLKDYREPPYKINGSLPEGLRSFEEINFRDSKLIDKSLVLKVPVKKLKTLDDKVEDFRFQRYIKTSSCIKFINDKLTGQPAGFSHDYCGVLEGTLFYNKEDDEWYVFIEIGQHRAAMAFIVGGEDTEVAVKVFIRGDEADSKKLLTNEAIRHHVDAVKRTGQNAVDKISSAFYSESESAEKLIAFYDKCQVSIGKLLPYEKTCDSWGDIQRSINNYGEELVGECLSSVSRFSTEKQIHAKVVTSLAQLCFIFKDRKDNFEKLNNLSFINTIVEYAFVSRKPKKLKMSDITKFSGKFKDTELIVATWIKYVNEMFEWHNYKRENKANSWMSRRSKEFEHFLDTYVEEIFHETFKQRIEQI